MPIYDYTVQDAQGNDMSLDQYEGQVVLIVNVASKCGFTPQYDGLQALYAKLQDQGFTILGFPCNQFKGQEPGTNEEIQTFCRMDYGVTFPVLAKIDVNGPDEDPLYTYLKSQKPQLDDQAAQADTIAKLEEVTTRETDTDILWNFEKFLVDRKGNVVGRYAPSTEPADLEAVITPYL